jgi:hypothetical protein
MSHGKRSHVGTYDDEKSVAVAYNKALVKFGKSLNYKNIIN